MWGEAREGRHAWAPGCRQWLWAGKAPVPVPECAFPLQGSQNTEGFYEPGLLLFG